VIKLLIDKGATISENDDLLYYACEHLHKDLVEFCIQKGANVNSERSGGWGDVPSFYILWNWDASKIADSNQPDIFKLLLDHGANPNAKDRHDWSLLHYAADDVPYIDMARMLLDKGANPNIRESIDGRTPLHHAANSDTRYKATVELLINRGADVNVKDDFGHTPLSMAKENGNTEVVDLLRKHGAKD
jgi:ankyrin repeat protein